MQSVTTWNKQASAVKNTDIIITNCALIIQKKAKITCLWFLLSFVLLFSFFLLFAIRRRLRSHFKNSCFVFYRAFQTPENVKRNRPNGFVLSSVFSCLETLVKHSHPFLKYYFKHLAIKSCVYQQSHIVFSWQGFAGKLNIDEPLVLEILGNVSLVKYS